MLFQCAPKMPSNTNELNVFSFELTNNPLTNSLHKLPKLCFSPTQQTTCPVQWRNRVFIWGEGGWAKGAPYHLSGGGGARGRHRNDLLCTIKSQMGGEMV